MNENHNAISLLETKVNPIHIIGAGGVGMSALGMILLKEGFLVTASDKKKNTYLEKLNKAGAKTWEGSVPENIPKNAIVFFSSAISKNNPERKFAEENNMPVFNRNPLLAYISKNHFSIAIAGCHGKTTTSAWIAYLLEQAGLDPNAIIGGTVKEWNSNVRFGSGAWQDKKILVTEADESDGSFLFLSTNISIVTNIDIDHVDFYKNINELHEKFNQFIQNTSANNGAYFISPQIPNELQKKVFANNITNKLMNEISQKININSNKLFYENNEYKVNLPGEHNLFNAACVLAVGQYLNIQNQVIKYTLENFTGVSRRMEILHEFTPKENKTITIIDDYAHHPVEVKAVLETLLSQKKNIIAVWEPHRISRFIHFFEDFKKVFEESIGLKNLYVLPVFYSGDLPENFPEYKNLFENLIKTTGGFINQKQNFNLLFDKILNVNNNVTIIFMGAGESSNYAHEFVSSIKKT
ncbi:MAG: UDP-N-acetylmuramate--L-alanine ligase [Spirochaetia bacterium]|nr:UDP-N-acetylmuramate--L-alanine ligase [Spirochaetia bacterium]